MAKYEVIKHLAQYNFFAGYNSMGNTEIIEGVGEPIGIQSETVIDLCMANNDYRIQYGSNGLLEHDEIEMIHEIMESHGYRGIDYTGGCHECNDCDKDSRVCEVEEPDNNDHFIKEKIIYTNIMEFARQESGFVVYENGNICLCNWASIDGIPGVFGLLGSNLVGLSGEMVVTLVGHVDKISELLGDEPEVNIPSACWHSHIQEDVDNALSKPGYFYDIVANTEYEPNRKVRVIVPKGWN